MTNGLYNWRRGINTFVDTFTPMARPYFALLWYLLVFTAAGCCKRKLYCQNDKLTIIISGYPRLDVRNVIIKKYEIGNHKKALDSATFIYNGTAPLTLNKKDTLNFADYKTTSATITGVYTGYDWDVYLPGTPGRENHRVTSVVDAEHRFEMVKCGDQDAKCLNPVGHFVVDGTWKQGDTLWIGKTK